MDRFTWQKSITKKKIIKKSDYLLQKCKGKKVLDVGCVGQSLDPNSKDWFHNKFKTVAASVKGVDINKEAIDKLNNLGYDISLPEDLEASGEKYDVIVMGDVIEHIGDIETFLNFYFQFLSEGGELIVTTPNPFSYRQFLNIFLFKRPFINEEHTCFIDPFNMYEICSRLNITIKDFYWMEENVVSGRLSTRIIVMMSKVAQKIRHYYAPNWGVVLTK